MTPPTSPTTLEFAVDAAMAGERFDRALSRLLGASVQGARRLIKEGEAVLDGRRCAPGVMLRVGQRINTTTAPTADDHAPVPQAELPLVVVDETNDFLVVGKPAGQPCHPLRPGERDTLANALVARYPETIAAGAFPREAGLVNRIDNDTSGIVLVARSRTAWLALQDASRSERMTKEYLALVEGEMPRDDDWQTIDLPIDHAGTRMRVGNGQPATTRYRCVRSSQGASLVTVELHVGRRHQIRVHLAHLGHPLVGDALYGATTTGARPGHILHSVALRLPAIGEDKMLDYRVGAPADFWASAAQFELDELALVESREPRLEQ